MLRRCTHFARTLSDWQRCGLGSTRWVGSTIRQGRSSQAWVWIDTRLEPSEPLEPGSDTAPTSGLVRSSLGTDRPKSASNQPIRGRHRPYHSSSGRPPSFGRLSVAASFMAADGCPGTLGSLLLAAYSWPPTAELNFGSDRPGLVSDLPNLGSSRPPDVCLADLHGIVDSLEVSIQTRRPSLACHIALGAHAAVGDAQRRRGAGRDSSDGSAASQSSRPSARFWRFSGDRQVDADLPCAMRLVLGGRRKLRRRSIAVGGGSSCQPDDDARRLEV